MPAPIFYSHTDASAPVLTGQAGKMIALLEACLVTGYGSKPAAGWTKPYSGTNLAAFKPETGSSGQLIRVDDTQARETRVRLYRTMSAISTGTGPAPSSSGYVRWWKAAASGATPRAWWLFADGRGFHLVVNSALAIGDPPSLYRYPTVYGAGDLVAFNSGDPAPFYLAGQPTADTTDSAYYGGRCLLPYATVFNFNPPSSADAHIFMSSDAAGANSVQLCGCQAFGVQFATFAPSADEFSYPLASFPASPFTSGYFATDMFLGSGAQGIRGRIPGMLYLPHHRPFTDWETVDIPGRGDCLAVPFSDGQSTQHGQILIRLEDWRA